MADICVGFEPIGIRQQIGAGDQFLGALPHLNGPPVVDFVIQDYSANRYDYGTPEGTVPMTKIGNDGGIFRFPEVTVVTEIRAICGAGSVLSIYVEERDGSSAVLVASGLSGVADRHVMAPEGLPVLPSQQIRILETVSGGPAIPKSLAVYVVKRGRMP